MSYVLVIDQERRPCAPIPPGRARFLLSAKRGAVWRRYPFTIVLKQGAAPDEPMPVRLKIDPGSKTTGLAAVNDATGQVVWAAELSHRGQQVKERLDQRRACRRSCRRSRRSRHTRYRHTRYRPARYRPARYLNRRRRAGWLPPSLESRIAHVMTWVERLRRYVPIGALSLELVKFDTPLLQHAEISGIDYQQGELAGYEVREYLLEKVQRRCASCGATNVPLQVEHLVPRTRGGSNRVSTLTMACKPCNDANDAKGTQTATEFGHPEVQAQAKAPLRDAAAVNATRWALYRRLTAVGLAVETGTGGRTKWNRTRQGLPKSPWLDAACVGASTPERLPVLGVAPLRITAMGRHSRQMCRTDASGFPNKQAKATSVVGGYRTGDSVRAVVPQPSVKAGTYTGRLAVRASGSCNLKTAAGTVEGIHVR